MNEAVAMSPLRKLLPILSVTAGIATFSAMDAAIKGASMAVGVFTALAVRNLFGTLMTIPLWVGAGRPLPSRKTLYVHAHRSFTTAAMAMLFFYGLVRIPMAEGVAISFIGPIIALYLAAVMLGEKIRPQAIIAALLGICGVIVITMERFGAGGGSADTTMGTIAILCSTVLYALNLVLQRRQALLAGPIEIALFQNGIATLIFLAFSPWFLVWPDGEAMAIILAGAVLATAALLFLSWGYARAEAQVLVPIEYTGFLWAALFGWWMFGERINTETLAGAVLIALGCWIGAKSRRPPPLV